MKIIENQSAEIWEQGEGFDNMIKHIERVARVCYQSTDLIKEGSAEKLVNNLINNGHLAMLEHGTVYMTIPVELWYDDLEYLFRVPYIDDLTVEKYSRIREFDSFVYITTNYRCLIDADKYNKIIFKTKPCWSKFIPGKHEERITVQMITNMQVSHEYVRHRVMSVAMESSRYCSYDKEKFGDEIQFILPLWLKGESVDKMDIIEWSNAMQDAENHYMRMRAKGWQPQQCAQFLPKATKTQLVLTGFKSDWDHFFDLRYFGKTGKPHPQAQELATIIYKLIYE